MPGGNSLYLRGAWILNLRSWRRNPATSFIAAVTIPGLWLILSPGGNAGAFCWIAKLGGMILAQKTISEDERDILLEAPPAPRRGRRFFVIIGIALLVLAWSFQGAKLRPGEWIQGVPQSAVTVSRMLPPDFSKLVDAQS